MQRLDSDEVITVAESIAGVHRRRLERTHPSQVGSSIGAFFLVLLLADLLTIPFASERFFDALFFARFQIEGVTLDLFDNVFGLHLALEATQGIF